MHFCRICRTEKNLKYTVKELRKFSRKRSNDKLLSTTPPTLGNICHECEERLHNFHRLDENEDDDNEERIIVDDDELLYNLFFEKMEQQRIMKRLITTGSGVGDAGCAVSGTGGSGSEWRATTLRQQTLVAATAAGVNACSGIDDVIELLTSRENTPSPSTFTTRSTRSATPVSTYQPLTSTKISSSVVSTTTLNGCTTVNGNQTANLNTTACNGTTSTPNNTATTKAKNHTPVVTTQITDKNQTSPYKVVAVIDLDDDDDDDDDDENALPPTSEPTTTSSLLTPQTTPDSDEEEIVFRKVEPDDGLTCTKYKRNKKNNTRKGKYQNRQINLIASLSLVSSDNDSDVEVTTGSEKSPTKPNIRTPQKPTDDENVVSTTTTEQLSPPPSNCSSSEGAIKASSSATTPTTSPKVIENAADANVKCPVCQLEFSATQRLIHHMRRKHRSYDGDELSERPRCAQDSAMTIRLRYMQRYNYYECQLCGCIDAVFKMHKEHVMQKHPIESKTLKDPMMQTLKCPVCKEKCGTQYVDLLRHMLQAHKIAQCRAHFRQVIHIRNLFTNCSGKKEKELQRTAKIYQITKRKQYYFECIQCHKIVTGYYNHVQHQSSHISKKVGVIKSTTTKTTKVVNNTKKNDRPKTAAATSSSSKPDTATRRSAKQSSIVNKIVKPLVVKDKHKNKDNSSKKKHSLTQQTCVAQQKSATQQEQQQQSRRKRKQSKGTLKAAIVKVKVKPPLKQLPTQRYNCNLCDKSFKGYHRLNLHIISLHLPYTDDGVLRCSICMLRFSQHTDLEHHEHERHFCKQKRKRKRRQEEKEEASDNVKEQAVIQNGEQGDDNRETTEKKFIAKNGLKISKPNQIELEPSQDTKRAKKLNSDVKGDINASWLHELLALATQKQSNEQNHQQKHKINMKSNENAAVAQEENNSNSKQLTAANAAAAEQCLYCGHLFNTLKELHSHEYVHVQRSEAKQLKRYSNDIFIKSASSS